MQGIVPGGGRVITNEWAHIVDYNGSIRSKGRELEVEGEILTWHEKNPGLTSQVEDRHCVEQFSYYIRVQVAVTP